MLFGILTIKPQLGILLPVVLLLERRWLTIASAAVTTAVLVGLTGMLFGWHIWIDFWQKVVPQQVWLTETERRTYCFRRGGVDRFTARACSTCRSTFAWASNTSWPRCAFAAVVWTFWKRRDPAALACAVRDIATFSSRPTSSTTTWSCFGFVVALLRDRPDNTVRDHHLLIAVWTLPVTMMLARLVLIPLAPIVLIAFAGRLLWRLAHSSTSEEKTAAGRFIAGVRLTIFLSETISR